MLRKTYKAKLTGNCRTSTRLQGLWRLGLQPAIANKRHYKRDTE